MQNVREDFPILQQQPLIYLDSAATGQKPQSVIDTINQFLSYENGTVHRGIYKLAAQATEKYNQVREKVAHFLNAELNQEIVFTRGTTDSINLVAAAYPFQKGDEIIISEMEHHSNIVPWQMLCERVGAILKIIPVNEKAELDLEVYQSLLGPKTKMVAIAHAANSTGTLNPIETIIEMAHQWGAKVLIDAAQTAARLRLDVQMLDADFLAFSGHKAFGPTGIGVLYGKYELLEQMQPVQGGGDMIEQVTLENTTYAKPPLRFEAGTPMIAQVMGLGAAIDYIQKLGLENIAKWEDQLLDYATEQLEKIPGLRIIGTAEKKTGIISFIHEEIHHLDLAVFLDLEGIAIRSGHHCAQPLMQRFGVPGTCRISFAPFNTIEEIDFLIESLNKTLKTLSEGVSKV